MEEQQIHLQNLTEQQKQLINDINTLNDEMISKREFLFKVQGAIEYIEMLLSNSKE